MNRARYFGIFLIIVTAFHLSVATNNDSTTVNKIDSLQKLLEVYKAINSNPKPEKIYKLHFELGDELAQVGRHRESIHAYESALNWANTPLDLFSSHAEISFQFWMLGKYDTALIHSLIAKEIDANTIPLDALADNYHRIAQLLVNHGDLEQATEHELEALKYSEQLQDSFAIAKSYGGLARIYWYAEDMEQAIRYDLQSMRIIEKVGTPNRIYRAYSDVGSSYTELHQLDSAMHYVLKARAIADSLNFEHGMAMTSAQIGEIYKKQQKYEKALPYINEALLLLKKEGKRQMLIADLTFMLGETLAELRYVERGIDTILVAYHLASSINYLSLQKDVSLALSQYYEVIEDYKSAYLFAKRFHVYKDSLMSQEIQENMEDLKNQYKLEKKDLQIQMYEQENQLKQKTLYVIGLVVVFKILALTVLFLIHKYRSQKQAKQLLERKNREIEIQHQRITDLRQDWQYFSNIISKNIQRYVWRVMDQLQSVGDEYNSLDDRQTALAKVQKDISRMDEELIHLHAFIEAGIYDEKTESLDIKQIIQVAKEMLPNAYHGMVRKIFYHNLPLIRANRYKMVLLYKHILIYAIKNRGENTLEVHIGCRLKSEDNGKDMRYEFIVQDNGKYLSPQILNHVFQMDHDIELKHPVHFHLAICNKIVSLYEGQIDLVSIPDKGNTLMITFPFEKIGIKKPIPIIQ